jgi:hypothetical protein
MHKGIYGVAFFGTGPYFISQIEENYFVGRLAKREDSWVFSNEESGYMTEGCATAGEAVQHILRRTNRVSEDQLTDHAMFILGMMVELAMRR